MARRQSLSSLFALVSCYLAHWKSWSLEIPRQITSEVSTKSVFHQKSCSPEVMKPLFATKLLYSCILLLFYHSPCCCFLSAATSMFFFDHQITKSSLVLVSRPYLGLSLTWLSREYLFIIYPLLSYLSVQLSYPSADITQWTIRLLTPAPLALAHLLSSASGVKVDYRLQQRGLCPSWRTTSLSLA